MNSQPAVASRPVRRCLLLALLLLLVACSQPTQNTTPSSPLLPVSFNAEPLNQPQPCIGAFVAHSLDFSTNVNGNVEPFDGNGSGLAIGDLDDDGRADIVLANLDGPAAIFWNQGDFHFQKQTLPLEQARAVNAVDVDGDKYLDLVFTHRYTKPTLLHNTGEPGPQRFEQTILTGVNNPFYSMAWGDLRGDSALELVAGSYDADLLKHAGPIFNYQGGGVGVFVYERHGQQYDSYRLAEQASALTIALPDIDGDQRPDILVGNDFNWPDTIWLNHQKAWQPATPFNYTSENTMSFDIGDLDNDGSPEIFAADMKPYHKDVTTMARWLPMMKLMSRPLSSTDPQHVENTLQVRDANGTWRNQAYERFVDSSGWSWSSKFGDLDNDGFLDLYVVNGMIANGLFDHLPDNELVEENLAFRNDGHGSFRPAPEWRLADTASGRGMSMADLNNDGRLDIVVNNLRSPAKVFENRLCGGSGLEVELRWPASLNTHAIGARLALETSTGMLYRDVRAASGYLSGDPSRVHFGLPDNATIQRIQITWPDGKISVLDSIQLQQLITVIR